jgi:glucose-1-phosphate thymidylyltransferase
MYFSDSQAEKSRHKGIIMAGGKGTRLYPVTSTANKHLLPVYNKPLIFYPLCTLMLAGIRDILIVCNAEDEMDFRDLLGNGSRLGLTISYVVQHGAGGIAEAFIVGEKFIGDSSVCLILGDNIFYGHGLTQILQDIQADPAKAKIFAYYVRDPQRFGVVDIDGNGKAVKIEEKPQNPTSNYAVTGLYFYDNSIVERAKNLRPSARGELEITDINAQYLAEGELRVEPLGRGIVWIDAGTFQSFHQACNFVQITEDRQGLLICCPEEIAYRRGFITKEAYIKSIELYKDSEYLDLLRRAL